MVHQLDHPVTLKNIPIRICIPHQSEHTVTKSTFSIGIVCSCGQIKPFVSCVEQHHQIGFFRCKSCTLKIHQSCNPAVTPHGIGRCQVAMYWHELCPLQSIGKTINISLQHIRLIFTDDAFIAQQFDFVQCMEGVEIVVPEGGYVTLRSGDSGQQVTQLQTVLQNLHYNIEVTGVYDSQTVTAVKLFQRLNGLNIDGVAGSATQTALYSGSCVPGDVDLSYATAVNVAPDGSDVQLLHWFNDVKNYLKENKVFTVYDPATGLSWKMKLYSPGNHADSEPLTAADSAIMYKAYGDKWTWSQRAVYVQLANGTWCIAAMPNMPHLSGSISDNDFEGHTCVHFPRTMTECAQNDPDYGVSVQETIRAHWKKITGEEIPW